MQADTQSSLSRISTYPTLPPRCFGRSSSKGSPAQCRQRGRRGRGRRSSAFGGRLRLKAAARGTRLLYRQYTRLVQSRIILKCINSRHMAEFVPAISLQLYSNSSFLSDPFPAGYQDVKEHASGLVAANNSTPIKRNTRTSHMTRGRFNGNHGWIRL